MSRLVNDMLSLARADAGFEDGERMAADLAAREETARKAQFLPRNAQWRVGSLAALEGMVVYGNADYLQQMLFIFIENAFKYTEEGYVALEAVRENEQVGIRIRRYAASAWMRRKCRIFSTAFIVRMFLGENVGTGLGLSIAKWIIDEHGGSIEVMTQKGKGTSFVIWLPAHYLSTEET